jgi:hypothetical protein
MKRFYFWILNIIIFSSLLKGQGITDKGIIGGLSYSKYYGRDATYISSAKYHLGYTLGLFMTLSLTDYLALQPEIYYTRKGTEYYVKDEASMSIKEKLNYLETPVFLSLFLHPQFSIMVGPYQGTFINGADDILITYSDAEESNTSEYKFSDIAFPDYGVAVGTSLYCDNGVGFHFRYFRGLRSIYRDTTYERKHSSFRIMLSSSF